MLGFYIHKAKEGFNITNLKLNNNMGIFIKTDSEKHVSAMKKIMKSAKEDGRVRKALEIYLSIMDKIEREDLRDLCKKCFFYKKEALESIFSYHKSLFTEEDYDDISSYIPDLNEPVGSYMAFLAKLEKKYEEKVSKK